MSHFGLSSAAEFIVRYGIVYTAGLLCGRRTTGNRFTGGAAAGSLPHVTSV